MPKRSTTDLPSITAAGRAWAERQHEAGAPNSWRASWHEALELGIADHQELARICAEAARARWRELRPAARKSASGTTIPHHARRGVQIALTLPPEDVARLDAIAARVGGRRRAISAALRAAVDMSDSALLKALTEK